VSIVADVEIYAGVIAGSGNEIFHAHREAARAVLSALESHNRLLPPGGTTYIEYGLVIKENDGLPGAWERIASLGTATFAKQHGTHKRAVTVWPSYSPNDYWAKHTTAWEPNERL